MPLMDKTFMIDPIKDARKLLRDKLIKLQGTELIPFTFPDGEQINIAAFNLLDMTARNIKLPYARTARELPKESSANLGSFAKGTELWVFGEETNTGYTRLLDHEGWLYTKGITLCC